MFEKRNTDSSMLIPRPTRNSQVGISIPVVGVPSEPTEEEIREGEKNLDRMWEYVHVTKYNEFLRSQAISKAHTPPPVRRKKKK